MTVPLPAALLPAPLDPRHRLVAAGLRAVAATGADRWLAPLARGAGVVLTFHRVRPWTGGAFAPNRYLEITPDYLDAAIRTVLAAGFEIVPVGEIPDRLRRGGGRPFAVLTFDDGYRDTLDHAWPVLRRHRVPWTVYVTASLAAGTGRLWWLELEAAVAGLDRVRLRHAGRAVDLPARDPAEKRAAYAALLRLLGRGDHAGLLAAVAGLAAGAGTDIRGLARRHCAGWDALRALCADPDVTVGSHTLSHPILARVPAVVAQAEIGTSRDVIAERLGRPVRHFAYPSGGADAAGPREFGLARAAGYDTAVTTRPGHLFRCHAERLAALPRVSVNGNHQSTAALRGLLSGVPFLGRGGLGVLSRPRTVSPPRTVSRPWNGTPPGDAARADGAGPAAEAAPTEVLLWHWGRAGAGAKFTHALLLGLRGVEGVAVRLCAAAGSDLDRLAPGGCTVRTFQGDRGTWAGRAAAAAALLGLPRLRAGFRRALEARPDTVALCGFQSIWDAAVLGVLRRRSGRFVLVLHDARFHPGDWYPFRPTVLARQIRAADGLIVLSEHVGRMAREVHGVPADRIWTVPHGAFGFGAPAVPRRFPAGRPLRLLFLGRIVAYKGLGLLIEAYRLLLARGVPVVLEIVGDGDLGRHAAALAGLPGVAVVNRWVSEAEIGAALARCDVVALTYVEASQSGVAAAAMTAGLPVVATPVGGLVEQVAHGRTGLVAGGLAPGQVADAVAALAGDPDLYERCSAGALRRAREELDWDRIAERVAAALRAVAARPRRART